jgi:hypothetical protein
MTDTKVQDRYSQKVSFPLKYYKALTSNTILSAGGGNKSTIARVKRIAWNTVHR